MPSFAKYIDNAMWVFPIKHGAFSKHPASEVNGSHAIDYTNGRVHEVDEISHLYNYRYPAHQRVAARKSIGEARQDIDDANADMRHPARIRLAALGNNIFGRIFETITGTNASVWADIDWTADLKAQINKPDTMRQGFRGFKARAGGKEVHFQVGIQYMPLLRKFVQLRDYLLNGTNADLMLFFYVHTSSGRVKATGQRKWQKKDGQTLTNTMLLIYPDYKDAVRINSHQSRSAVQDYLIRTQEPIVAAQFMGHRLRTALQKYSNGSAEQHREEVGEFMVRVYDRATTSQSVGRVEEERALGSCAAKGEPHAISSVPPVKPDCKSTEGCLFCDKHRVHADEQDIRKLLSGKYVIEQMSNLANSVEEKVQVFGKTLSRIDHTLEEMRGVVPSSASIIERVAVEVELGEMDPFWSLKLEELIELGVL
jgi:hypothetical protein